MANKNKVKNTPKEAVTVAFPARLLTPVGDFLHRELKKLERNKKDIDKEDPFKDEARATDNAAMDTEADEQFGHARTSAIKNEIDKRIVQTRKALTRVKLGKYGICENCGKMIDTDRLIIYPEATLCVDCERKK